LKEEQFLRYLLATGALALMLAGTSGFAAAAAPSAGTTVMSTAAAAAATDDAGSPGESPDVAVWAASQIQAAQPAAVAKTVQHQRHFSTKFADKFASRIFTRTSTIAKSLTSSALRFLGTPYVFGGTSPSSGFDCSAYVQHVFAMVGISIPRTADAQFYAAHRAIGGPRVGDLVFFQTYEPGPSHVGIYLGNGRFAHASSSHGVMVSRLSDSYWSARYIGTKRVLASR
jgi:cell wall-associated NlpC family hydrolase